MAAGVDQQEFAQKRLAQAREQGIDLVGCDGLLNRLTKDVLEAALEAEMDEHKGTGTKCSDGDRGRWRSTCRGTPVRRSIRRS